MKKFAKILSVMFAVIMIASAFMVGAGASSAYQTYTYSIDGYPLLSPDAYDVEKTVTSADMGLEIPLNAPSDIITDKENNVYIADTKNNRIVCLDRYYKVKKTIHGFVNGVGNNDSLLEPQGVFVTDDTIWVCDTGRSRIVAFDKETYEFIKVLEAPESHLFENDAVYKPVAMAVDEYNRLFVVSSTTYQGIIVMTDDGAFQKFIGAQAVEISAWEIIWRKLRTEEQQAQQEENIASEFNNIALGADGFIYVTTSTIDEGTVRAQILAKAKDGKYLPVKMLNTSGDEIMRRNGFWPPAGEVDFKKVTSTSSTTNTSNDGGVSKIIDVAEGEEGTWSIIDEKRKRVYTYDKNGNLLFAFGEEGNMMGSISAIKGITYQGDKMLILDSTISTNNFTVFTRTPYGNTIIEAIAAENNQEFSVAINKWTDVLKSNSNFDAAYVGIGQAMYRNGEYERSLEYFESAYDTTNWSNSYKEIRKEWMSSYFLLLIAILVAIIVGISFFNKFIKKVNSKAALSGKKKTFGQELAYGFHVILHPFDGFWDLKHEKRGSVRAATVYIVITILAFFYQSIGSGYLLNPEGNFGSIWNQVLGVLVPLFLFILANWCLTTLFDGEGSFKDIYIACGYSLLPLPMILIPVTIYSNFCILTEVSILNFLTTIAFIWLGLLLILGTQVTHDYTMGKNIITILGTLVAMVFNMFVAILFSTLITKMVSLVTNIVTEIQFRI